MTIEQLQDGIKQAVEAARIQRPMAGSITNTVTINLVANAQLAVGGTAAMVYLPDEAEFLAKASGATYINVGTMLPIYGETLIRVAQVLHDEAKPWVLDAVAIGIGALRTQVLREYKFYKPGVIRGNASEIIALAGLWDLAEGTVKANTGGVESTDAVDSAAAAALALARWTGGAVAVSGASDLVTDGKVILRSNGGSKMMERITGCGCSLGGVQAVYAAVTTPLLAALTGTQIYNAAGRKAQSLAQGPASFQTAFLDELYNISAEEVAENELSMEVL